MRRVAVALVLAAAAAVPATADAENYLNSSSANGGHVVKSGRMISTFELFCTGHTDDYFDRQFAFSVRDLVSLGRKGKFSYSGYAFRYGPERQPRGELKVKL